MNLFQISISIFCFIETLNILMLYFKPESKIGNGVGVFDAFHRIKEEDNKEKPFVMYLINWVAGTKLIFIMVGIVVVIFGNYQTQLFTVIALIISILSFYWRLYPIIRELDKKGEISPKGYHKTLNIMIISFLVMFSVLLALELIL